MREFETKSIGNVTDYSIYIIYATYLKKLVTKNKKPGSKSRKLLELTVGNDSNNLKPSIAWPKAIQNINHIVSRNCMTKMGKRQALKQDENGIINEVIAGGVSE